MNDKEKQKQEVLWNNARESKLARKEIANSTPKHRDATPRGRVLNIRSRGR